MFRNTLAIEAFHNKTKNKKKLRLKIKLPILSYPIV